MGIPPKATKSNNASAGQASKSCGPFYREGETNKNPMESEQGSIIDLLTWLQVANSG